MSLCYHCCEDLGIVLKSYDPFCLIGETNGIQWVTSLKFMSKSAGKLLLKFCRDSSLRLSYMDLYLEFKRKRFQMTITADTHNWLFMACIA